MPKYIFLFGIVCSVICCKKNNATDETRTLKLLIDNILGKKLIIHDSFEVYSPFKNYNSTNDLDISNYSLKLFSHIDSSCGTCVNSIELWNDLALEFEKYQVEIILILGSDDDFETFKYLCESKKNRQVSLPILL